MSLELTEQLFESGLHRDHAGREYPYRLLRPQDPPAQAAPLVVYLHGAGQRGNDNRQHLCYLPELLATPHWRDAYPCFALAVQCPLEEQWVDAPWEELQSRPMADEPTPALQAVADLVDHWRKTPEVDEKRVYLTGLSMGGYGTWELACRHPDWFAAMAPICGGGDETQAARLASLPLWAFHGSDDDVVPVERSRSMIAAVHAAGGDPRYTEFAGEGHHSWIPAYENDAELFTWMFAQRRDHIR